MNNVVLNVDINVDVFEECLTLITFIMCIVNINVRGVWHSVKSHMPCLKSLKSYPQMKSEIILIGT